MHGFLITDHGHVTDPDADAVGTALDADAGLWLDIAEVDPPATALLHERFGIHPLAIEDAEHFGQRAKIEPYGDFTLIVAYGVAKDGTPVEAHLFVAEHYLVTVHRSSLAAWSAVADQLRTAASPLPSPITLTHRLWDGLIDDYFPALAAIDEAIDALQDDILHAPTDAQLRTMFDLKRRLITLRRLAFTQDDMTARLLSGVLTIPGMTDEEQRYFRDLNDHLTRISQTADGYRDMLASARETHLAMTSNRMNVVMKQLTIIATLFLPLSFLTGFFGQNFDWLVHALGSSTMFWIFGIGLQVAAAGGLLVMFRRMGWLTPDSAASPRARPSRSTRRHDPAEYRP